MSNCKDSSQSYYSDAQLRRTNYTREKDSVRGFYFSQPDNSYGSVS